MTLYVYMSFVNLFVFVKDREVTRENILPEYPPPPPPAEHAPPPPPKPPLISQSNVCWALGQGLPPFPPSARDWPAWEWFVIPLNPPPAPGKQQHVDGFIIKIRVKDEIRC